MRALLSSVGVRNSGPAFYQMMARLEESGLVEGWYEQKILAGQTLKERRYRLTRTGLRAVSDTRAFYLERLGDAAGEAVFTCLIAGRRSAGGWFRRRCASVPSSRRQPTSTRSSCRTRRRAAPARFGRLSHNLRLLVLALECRRLAVSARWSDPLPEHRENRMRLWFRDLRHTIRQLIRQPMFAATAILTLALGTGANLTIFSFVNTFLLAPIQAASPDRLVRVYGVAERTERDVVSFPDYLDARTAASGVDLAAHAVTSARIGAPEAVETRAVELVTGNYFRVLGLSPAAGRLIDEATTRRKVRVRSSCWRTDSGARDSAAAPRAIGQTLADQRRPVRDRRRRAARISRHVQRPRRRSLDAVDDAPGGASDRAVDDPPQLGLAVDDRTAAARRRAGRASITI